MRAVSISGYRAWKRDGKAHRRRRTDALTMAWFRSKPAPGVRLPSDRGSQHARHACQDKLDEDGMTCSMSRRGNGGESLPHAVLWA